MTHNDRYQQVREWIADDPDATSAAELQQLLDRAESESAVGDPAAGDPVAGPAAAELADRFAAPLTFGTAGLRGPMRAGPNGMNVAVVRRAAAGLAAYLATAGHHGGTVVVGYDGRHGSHRFAQDTAAILAAAGFAAKLMPRLLPTPVLAFSVQRLSAVAGVMVTASHNPPQDNGYKVYAGDGAQIVPPMDRDIEAAIRAVPSVRGIAMSADYEVLDESIVDDYIASVSALVHPESPREIDIVHTAMHGVGTAVLRSVFARAGFPPLRSVEAQAEPDPEFSTVSFPNPEEPGAMDLALELAERSSADLIIANDPDADRCAVGVPVPTPDGPRWRMLRGDEVGVLLADWLLSHGVTGSYATTIVSSTMLSAMARRHGVGFAETLTGFKWISRAAPDLVYGYEEALGYAVAPHLVRDKDGISAALMVAELAATLKARGSSLPQRLTELAAVYGNYATSQLSWRVTDLSLISVAMQRLRAEPPATLRGLPVQVTDLAPDNDVVILRFGDGRVVVRPSGTEPKCKAYLEIVVPVPATEGGAATAAGLAEAGLAELAAEVTAAVGL